MLVGQNSYHPYEIKNSYIKADIDIISQKRIRQKTLHEALRKKIQNLTIQEYVPPAAQNPYPVNPLEYFDSDSDFGYGGYNYQYDYFDDSF